jgi:hypothetical protein
MLHTHGCKLKIYFFKYFLQALLQAHDKIAEKYEPKEGTSSSFIKTQAEAAAPWEEITPSSSSTRPVGSILKQSSSIRDKDNKLSKSNMSVDSEDSNVQYAQPIRIISLRKSPSQPLVKIQKNALFYNLMYPILFIFYRE